MSLFGNRLLTTSFGLLLLRIESSITQGGLYLLNWQSNSDKNYTMSGIYSGPGS
jgi:hypothetical protein